MSSTNGSDRKSLNMAEAVLGPSIARGQNHDIALVCGDETVTYCQLWHRVNHAGNAFLKLGISKGDRTVMMVRDTPEFFYCYLGLMKIGAVPIAVNLRLSAADVAYTLNDSEAKAFILDNMFIDGFQEIAADVTANPAVIITDAEYPDFHNLPNIMDPASKELEAVELKPNDPALWMYSSGTTGKPKGVVHSQKSIFSAEHLMGELMGVGPGDRIYGSSKLFFAFSLAHCFLAPIRLGATVILYPEWPDAASVAAIVEKYKPTILLSVPTFYRNMLRDGVAENQDFKNVRYYLTAGEKLPRSLFDQWMEATGRPMLEGIGATETCFLFLANRPDKMNPGTCGVPTPGTEVKIIDKDGDVVTEPNMPGVLWVRMSCVASGYWNMKKKTREVFKDGWYCTNDMFTFDEEGWYEYQGRADDMLKISGQWVSPSEIEDQVLKNDAVQEAAVVGVPNEDGLVRLALFMVAPDISGSTDALEQELTDSLTANLSIYKCPRRMFFVDEMPLTATGKLQRFALRQMAENSPSLEVS
ncbi:MAG: benzoate-CoA ligase family protein [Rhodospirillaceae bacterium]|nr:benzoate-CoA ligase family protein [Rhodospirillaceae bacterium]